MEIGTDATGMTGQVLRGEVERKADLKLMADGMEECIAQASASTRDSDRDGMEECIAQALLFELVISAAIQACYYKRSYSSLLIKPIISRASRADKACC